MYAKFTFYIEPPSFGGELYIPPVIFLQRKPEICDHLPEKVIAEEYKKINLKVKTPDLALKPVINKDSDDYKLAKKISDQLIKTLEKANYNSADEPDSASASEDEDSEEKKSSDNENADSDNESSSGSVFEYYVNCGKATKVQIQKAFDIMIILFCSSLTPLSGIMGEGMATLPTPAYPKSNLIVEAFRLIFNEMLKQKHQHHASSRLFSAPEKAEKPPHSHKQEDAEKPMQKPWR
jgi:hypothetical protein